MAGAGRHGPVEVFAYIDGYDLLLNDVQGLQYEEESETVDITGLGDSFREHAPTGIARVAVSVEGTVFNDDTGGLHSKDALETLSTGPQTTNRYICLGAAGTTIGSNCEEFEGAVQGSYQVLATLDDLQRINATFQMTGARNPCQVLFPLDMVGADGNSQSTSVDNGSSSTGGLVGQLHVNTFDGDTGDQILVTIQESSNDSTYADIITFTCTSSTGSPFVDRQTVATSGVERYLAITYAFTDSGLGDADIFVAAGRT